MQIIEIVLDSNIFTFGDTHCKQTDRTAIGKKICKHLHGSIGKRTPQKMLKETNCLSQICGRYIWYMSMSPGPKPI